MSGAAAEPALHSNRPSDSKFKQQALPAWQPILTAGTVLPTFFVIGLAFVPIGIGLMYFSNGVNEVIIEYTDCMSVESSSKTCADVISDPQEFVNGKPKSCKCELEISKEKIGDKDWAGPVFLYYGLTNFYQNHRRYVKSRDDKQLYGDISREPSTDCAPFAEAKHSNGTMLGFYAPCGAIANSLFNDTIKLQYEDSGSFKDIPLEKKGIAWQSDKEYKFKNPPVAEGQTLQQAFEAAGVVKPMDWQKEVWELDPSDDDNNGFLNEDLIVWMRTAALPNFRKLYRKIIHADLPWLPGLENGLPGDRAYHLSIDYNYPVKSFSGTKTVILSTTSLLGGKNPFLGIAYIVVGSICFVMGVIFLFIHLKFGRTTQEMMNIGSRSQYNS